MRIRSTPEVDARWLACVLADTETLLADHAHCEKKAAGSALSFIARHPGMSRLVAAMAELAVEEMGHFAEVHQRLVKRGGRLGPDHGDPYARALLTQVRSTPRERLIDRLLVSALIEARSAERLRLLGRHHPEPELAEMFTRFAKSEAGHQNLFEDLAVDAAGDGDEIAERLAELARFEEELIASSPIRCAMH